MHIHVHKHVQQGAYAQTLNSHHGQINSTPYNLVQLQTWYKNKVELCINLSEPPRRLLDRRCRPTTDTVNPHGACSLTGGTDPPLTGGTDPPLTGGTDPPLTGGTDPPLTGGTVPGQCHSCSVFSECNVCVHLGVGGAGKPAARSLRGQQGQTPLLHTDKHLRQSAPRCQDSTGYDHTAVCWDWRELVSLFTVCRSSMGTTLHSLYWLMLTLILFPYLCMTYGVGETRKLA